MRVALLLKKCVIFILARDDSHPLWYYVIFCCDFIQACFTHPEIGMVGPTEEQAKEMAEKEGWTLAKSSSSFKANSKALAEGESNGVAKCLYKKETGEVVAVHIIGLHAADLIQECANAVASGATVQEMSMIVHTHPTLSEVVDAMFKDAAGMASH